MKHRNVVIAKCNFLVIKGILRVAQSEPIIQHTAAILSAKIGEKQVNLCAIDDNTEIILVRTT